MEGYNFDRIAVKVGSNVITQPDGSLNSWRISKIVEDISTLFLQGKDVILITSGAVASGRGEIKPSQKTNLVTSRQVLAAVGQVKLMSSYQFLFGKYGIAAGQVLATKESFADRLHYRNMKNCMSAMLGNRVIPVVNENDTVAVDELMFTDNDALSGLIASLMECDALIILTNVDGIFDGNPGQEGSTLIREIGREKSKIEHFLLPTKSQFGRGGMLSKYSTSRKTAAEGTDVFIANGTRDSIICDILKGKDVPFTHFLPASRAKRRVRNWL
jgi:glutamate 5-kinase